MKVSIPFKERFKEPLLTGTKTWTTRTRQYGKKGDTFEAFGATFILDEVGWKRLREVGKHWKEEGCNSLENLIEVWCEIHPKIGYNPNALFCVHIFHEEAMTK